MDSHDDVLKHLRDVPGLKETVAKVMPIENTKTIKVKILLIHILKSFYAGYSSTVSSTISPRSVSPIE